MKLTERIKAYWFAVRVVSGALLDPGSEMRDAIESREAREHRIKLRLYYADEEIEAADLGREYNEVSLLTFCNHHRENPHVCALARCLNAGDSVTIGNGWDGLQVRRLREDEQAVTERVESIH